MQQEELTTSQLCLLDIVSRRQMTRQTNLWKPQGHGTHINITLWRGALRGGSSLDSHFHSQQSTLVPTWMPEVKTAFPRFRLIIQHKVASETSDWGPELEMASHSCCSRLRNAALCRGTSSALQRITGCWGQKPPIPTPGLTRQPWGAEAQRISISLSPFFLPLSCFPTPQDCRVGESHALNVWKGLVHKDRSYG